MFVIDYQGDVDPGRQLLVPRSRALRSLQRLLMAELRSRKPDRDEVDALCMAILSRAREDPDQLRPRGASMVARVDRIRALADARYTEPDLDLVGEGAALGMSRTRMVHDFGATVGITPHRYLLELRTTHAAHMLTQTRASVTEICFESGFGSMTRFHAAFSAAFGTTPSGYRTRYN